MTSIKTILVVFIFYSGITLSGTSDLELTSNLDTIQGEFMHSVPFTITVRNLGPDSAGGDSISLFPNDIHLSEQALGENGFLPLSIIADTSFEQDCNFGLIIGEPGNEPGDVPLFVYTISMPKINVGQSITCYGIYGIGIEQGQMNMTWTVLNAIKDVDPNLDNNSVNFSFGTPPRVIPTLGFWGTLILAFISILIGALPFGKKQKRISNLMQ